MPVINRLSKGGDPEKVKKSIRDRFKDEKIVDELVELDAKWRECKYLSSVLPVYLSLCPIARFSLDKLNKKQNSISKEIGAKKKQNKDDPCTVSSSLSSISYQYLLWYHRRKRRSPMKLIKRLRP